MRLIDADEMLKRLEEWNTNDGIDKAFYNFCFSRIIEQPTAYSVEKVVAELEEEKQKLKTLKNDCIALCDSEVIAIEEKAYNFAIGCVRNGGKE